MKEHKIVKLIEADLKEIAEWANGELQFLYDQDREFMSEIELIARYRLVRSIVLATNLKVPNGTND